ncbi:hypothetical protein [Nakamurella sp. PAMC28650]|uniref:hypothetical protein n=1 Tax=Nakamurella sp. PAMC28650 TaxID=2762325 RepID=UPI00164CF080|nr:hypothetical protein [Nakamurella sp. PAMC28650]QNK80416.1 hypothetical protein H7F38_19875 [Nakamurella sp. PAMC28650]
MSPMFRSASIPVVGVPVANLDRITLPDSATLVPEVEEVTSKVAALRDQPPADIADELVADAERRAGLRLLMEARDTASSTAAALYGSLFSQIPGPDQITAAANAEAQSAALTHLVDRAATSHIPTDRWSADVKQYVATTAGRINGLPPLPLSKFEIALDQYREALRRNLPNLTPPRSTDADLAAEQASAAYVAARAAHANVPGLIASSVYDVQQGHRHALDVLTFADGVLHDSLPPILAQHAAAVELIAAADASRLERGLG